MDETNSCVACGNKLTTSRKGLKKGQVRKYCSLKCYRDSTSNGNSEPCKMCGKIFRRPSSQHHVYCSKECQNKSLENKVVKICPVCNETYEIPASNAERYTVCSLKCRRAFTIYRNCDSCGKLFTARPHKIRFCSLSCYRHFGGESSLETKVRELLNSLQFSFEQEAKIGRYSVDFYLNEFRLVIECDGDYWHRNKKRDARKNHYLKKNAYRLLRLNEKLIVSGKAGEKIESVIKNTNLVLV